MTQPQGYLALVLHAHLPFVRHPEHEAFLEEDWLFEAITECYLPLLEVFAGWERDGVPWKLAMSVTPTLAAMLQDELLQQRYVRHIEGLIALVEKELGRTTAQPEFHRLARMYHQRFVRARQLFVDEYRMDLVAGFRAFQDTGKLEILASAATHGYLPLMHPNRAAVRAQVQIGIDAYRRAFGRNPAGFWLPECGYAPPDDELLAAGGICWFVAETHALLHARPRPWASVYAPIRCPSSGVAVFGRDPESSKQVWSAAEGYPGDWDYREFYRDIGYDLDYEYVRPWLKGGVRSHTGIKYYRITGPTEAKQPYDPDRAREKAALHAGNFMFSREKQVEYWRGRMDRPPIVVAPYDAELFGHWWFEGPQWLDFLVRKIAYDQRTIALTTPSEYLERFPAAQAAQPSMSSWGHLGYSEVWLNGANDWIYRHLHAAAERMIALADAHRNPGPLLRRALNQAARELLLAQSSDWAFIMTTGTTVDYAIRRTKAHLARFNRLFEQIQTGNVDVQWLEAVERKDNLFPWLDYRVYASGEDHGLLAAAGAPGSMPAALR
ncbi:MAG: glycoside hydrolase [Firmicutes bacterium ZCTH02-B6]|nr:MAG: glycoside hydrolase [Firmicutes bacterium ZCTH02-B6]